jgi:hypothetical protein
MSILAMGLPMRPYTLTQTDQNTVKSSCKRGGPYVQSFHQGTTVMLRPVDIQGKPFLARIGFKTGEGSVIWDRHSISDEQWEWVRPALPGKIGDRGRSAADNRRFVDAVLCIAATGAPWRDLPESFGNWNSNFHRFRRWAVKGIFDL